MHEDPLLKNYILMMTWMKWIQFYEETKDAANGICPVSDAMVEGYTKNLMMGLESTFG